RGLLTIIGSFAAALVVWSLAMLLPLPALLAGAGSRIALAILLGVAAALAASRFKLLLGEGSLEERRRRALGLAAGAVGVWFLAWGVFHLAVTSQLERVGAGESMRTFFVGQLVGLASLVPGGFGSADLYWGARLTGGHDRVLAALAVYRGVYYALPFLFA